MAEYLPNMFVLIINLNKSNFLKLKVKLIDFIKQTQTDDRIYIKNELQDIFFNRGKAVACLANYKCGESVPGLMRDAIEASQFEYQEFRRIMYIFSDKESDSFQLGKMLKQAETANFEVYFKDWENFDA